MTLPRTGRQNWTSCAVAVLLGLIAVGGAACSTDHAPTASVPSPASAASGYTCRGGDGTVSRPHVGVVKDKAEEAPDSDTEAEGGLYGDPDGASRYWAEQSEGDCGLMATRLVIAEITGQPPTEREMIDLAANTASECSPGEPVYDESIDPSDGGVGHGTCSTDLLLLLDHFGIDAEYTNDDEAADGGLDTGIDALADYLGDGRQAMVCVNSRIIWDTDGDRANCGHMVTVAAIDFDNDIVYLGDSGGDDTRGEEIDIDVFESAWATGDHELIVTDPR